MIHDKRCIIILLIFMLLTFVCMSCSNKKPATKKCGSGYVWVPGHTANNGIWVPGRCARK